LCAAGQIVFATPRRDGRRDLFLVREHDDREFVAVVADRRHRVLELLDTVGPGERRQDHTPDVVA
jgi:hypothetical protein